MEGQPNVPNSLLDLENEAGPWQDRANCKGADPDIFFPDTTGKSISKAKAICNACDVTVECLEYALSHREKFGIWGGLTERERRRVRRERALSSID